MLERLLGIIVPVFAVIALGWIWGRRAKPDMTVVNRLSMEIAKIARSPDMRERFEGMGAEPVGSTPEEFGAVMARDIAKWTALAKSVGIKID